MKLTVAAAVLSVTAFAASAYAGINVNLNIGTPPVVVQPAPPPMVVVPPPPPEPAPPEVVFETAPRFIFSPALGFYVSVETPYDVVYIGDRYYLYNGGFWYASPYYNGPWVVARGKRLPPKLHRFRHEEIRRYRDVEYRVFVQDREHYRGRWHAPPQREMRERKREQHEERRENKEERRERHEERQDHWERR